MHGTHLPFEVKSHVWSINKRTVWIQASEAGDALATGMAKRVSDFLIDRGVCATCKSALKARNSIPCQSERCQKNLNFFKIVVAGEADCAEWDELLKMEFRRLKSLRSAKRRRELLVENGGTYSKSDVNLLFEVQQGRCYYCGFLLQTVPRGWHLDHVQPVASGGSNAISNLVLACRRCNNAKSNQTLASYLRKIRATLSEDQNIAAARIRKRVASQRRLWTLQTRQKLKRSRSVIAI